MSCRFAQRAMGVVDDLSPARRRVLDRHVAQCARCAAAWEDELAVRAHMRDLPRVEPPPGLEAALLAVPRVAAPVSARPPRTTDGPMTFEQWLRTFAVLVAVGLGAAGLLGDAPERAPDPAPAAPVASAPAATVVARRNAVPLHPGARQAPAPDVPSAATAAAPLVPVAATPIPAATPTPPPLAPTAPAVAVLAEQERGGDRRPDHAGNADDGAISAGGDVGLVEGGRESVASSGPTSGAPVTGGADKEPQPAAGSVEPESTTVPEAVAPARRCVAVPVVVFADVGGGPEGLACLGCDGLLSDDDRRVAEAQGLRLPAFQLALYDSAEPPAVQEKTVPAEHADGPIYRDVLELCGQAPFTATILALSDGWSTCGRVGAASHVVPMPPSAELRFPVVDRCPPAVPTPAGPTALAQPDPGQAAATPAPPVGQERP